MPSNSESFLIRAEQRKREWAMEAFDADNKILATNGKSTELLRYPDTAEDAFKNILALQELCEMFYDELRDGTRLDKTQIFFGKNY